MPEPAPTAADAAGIQGLGERLRARRRELGLSARTVAERAGVSPTYLSRVENGHISPTVATLTRVVAAMGESVASLLDGVGAGPLVRRAERRVVHTRGVDDFLMTPASAARLEVFETVIEPGGSSGPRTYAHPGDEECILVQDGLLHVWLDDARYELTDGDALTFRCRTPHRWRNPGERPTRALWIITPARY